MLEFIKSIAREAGEICLREASEMTISRLNFKSARDLVTDADRKVEEHIIAAIAKSFPGHGLLGEETGVSGQESEHRWIVDPIDGTVSYFHGQPYYSVSIAYQYQGVTRAGIVYAPALGQMFSAEYGGGAWLNSTQKLSVSLTDSLINALMATGFACLRAGRQPNNLYYLNKVLPKIRDIRRCGSAAIDLAYVAAGKVDAFWEMDLNLYDIAAGVLLVQEAGGKIMDFLGGDEFPEKGIVATNGHITSQLLELLEDFPNG
ncbi:MAG: inositol monophosphatase family protein [Desulfocapsaceae bacterium]|nr:inositol monophosphatase family protein [Desulfocapsaceae bacterium]